ncbi:hypothetical protein OESDEN_14537 [Oesophagostomum dentatum]|uniref:ZIP Zinc transporter n=1 Tax=Oesophagostomum dentatum TaxID=61180 RepID=A0A0B1SLC9_OESDE|nr:hypothetical protein OESDEN_14537 [Oesophagostomum dentatum]
MYQLDRFGFVVSFFPSTFLCNSLLKNNAKAVVKSLTFVLALMFHASLEGFAFGVQNSDMDELTKNAVTCILVSLSLGTFIHITFFEPSYVPTFC